METPEQNSQNSQNSQKPAANGQLSEQERLTAIGEAFLKARGVGSDPDGGKDGEKPSINGTQQGGRQGAADGELPGSQDEPGTPQDPREAAGQALIDAMNGEAAEPVDNSTEPAKIDYDLEIPMPDGFEPMRLGDMKDLATEYSRREMALTERESALNQQQQEIGQMAAILGQQVPPQVREQLQQRQQQHIREQSALLLDMVPGMADPVQRERIVKGVTELAKSLGYSEQEIAHLSNAKDFRTLYLHWELRQRWEQATAKRAEVTSTEAAPRRGKGNNSQGRREKLQSIARDMHHPDRHTAIGELLLNSRKR